MDDHATILARVRDLTDQRGCDRVIEAVGKQWPLDLAGELVCEGGRLVIAGYHQDGPRQVNMQQWNWKGIDVVNAHERDPAVQLRGLREAVEAVAGGRLDRVRSTARATRSSGSARRSTPPPTNPATSSRRW